MSDGDSRIYEARMTENKEMCAQNMLAEEIVSLHKTIKDLRKQLAEADKEIKSLKAENNRKQEIIDMAAKYLRPFNGTAEDVAGFNYESEDKK